MSDAVAVIRQDEEGEQFWFAGGGVWAMKASAAETGGSFALWEDRVVRGKTTPLHLHPNVDEALYVLEGEILMHLDGAEHRVGEHGFAMAPRGVPHAFLVTSETARLLVLLAPGAGEAFFRSASDPVTSAADASRPPDLDRLREAAERSDTIELLGPPPFTAAEANPQAAAGSER
jgi:quercetin dioxygenase-like cupin family protein